MKQSGRILLLGALLASARLYSAPFLAVGDNAELFLTGALSVKADDNIYLNPAGRDLDDTVWTVTPGIDLVFGKGAATQGNFYYREDIVRYSDHGNQDTNLSNVGLNSRYDDGKSKFDLAASYAQVAQNDNNVNLAGALVDRDVVHFHAKPEFGATEKTSVALGIVYDKTTYGPAAFSDLATWALPLDVYFEYSPKLQVSLGYRYRDNQLTGGGVDSKDHFFNIGARGEFTPKLSGQVRVGYNSRDLDIGGDDSGLGLDASLTYKYSDKTSLSLTASNDFNNSGVGDQTKVLRWGITGTSKLTEQWSVNGGFSYSNTDYPARTDTYIEGNVGATYVYNQTLNFTAGYTYRENFGGKGGADFKNNVFSIGANVRY